MQGKIVVKRGFSVVGVAKKGSHQNEKDATLISDLWEEILSRQLEVADTLENDVITGICIPPRSDDYFYIAGMEVCETERIPEGMSVHTFPTFTYVRYTHKGSVKHLFRTYEAIWSDWFPKTGYELVDGPELEVVTVDKASHPFSDQYEMDIYLPIKIGS
ncbi:GyrI-like domain-containing protein [Metabacillus iocasae]|uniref:AraC family transcriptional regulator n=1 Tax=Priestia iocasae TaxID=2291674 RepID=A0ABS2QTZ0_9BACI|nr:GyrI-like domain-containing protein [Metabacillus iocasae]MBM7702930.1 AraC family transcriptional regulator [Metabacillus iocasae]